MITKFNGGFRFGATFLLVGLLASGETLVTTAADENNGSLNPTLGAGTSLREAVLHSPTGSNITFAPALAGQTLIMTSGQLLVSKNLHIDASSLEGGITLSGNQNWRIFKIEAVSTTTLTALRLIQGDRETGDGGAINNVGNLTLDRCEIRNNLAETGSGGAIKNSGTLTMTACTLADNHAEHEGGAIAHVAGTLTATHCTFAGNTAGDGGAVAAAAAAEIMACTIDGNLACGSGGGVYHPGGGLTVRNSTISGNCSVEPDFSGGGIYSQASLLLESCTIAGNEAYAGGSGIHVETGGLLSLRNSIIAGNANYEEVPDDIRGSIATEHGVNLVSTTAGIAAGFAGIVGTPNLSPLADNGGPTQTMLPLPGSPAINAGGITTLTVDQRGLPRVVGAAVDIGAVEVQGEAIPVWLDVLHLRDLGQAVITSSPYDIGHPDEIFDGNLGTLYRSAAVNPAFIQVTFNSARTMTGFQASFSSGGPYQWKVEKADTQADMDSRTGTWAELFPWQAEVGDDLLHGHDLGSPVVARIYKLVVQRLTDNYVHINEWGLRGLVANPCEPVTLSIAEISPSGIVVRSTPLGHSSYQLQTSFDLVHWRNSGFVFTPTDNEHTIPRPATPRYFLRLACEDSPNLSSAAEDATTVTLNWPPTPGAVLYKVYRNGSDIGNTVGVGGFFTDTGLTPDSSYEYRVEAFGSSGRSLGSSPVHSFTTASSSRIRTRYRQLGIGFYPGGPDADFPHVRTLFRHRMDFLRIASVNTAILEPYGGDLIPILATPPVEPGTTRVDYVALVETPYPELGGRSIVDLVESGEVDVVNVVAFAGIDFLENALVGNKGRNVGGSGEQWPAYPARCSRSFFVNANSADSRAFDAFAHCIEGIMSTACDGHPATWPRSDIYQIHTKDINDFTTLVPRNVHLFERFRLADQWNGLGPQAHASPGNGNCGSSHFPPNSRRDTDASYLGDYAYYDRKTWQRYIDCASDDWLAFPALTGATRKLNGYDYGAFNRYTEGDPAYGAAFGVSPELHPSFATDPGSFHQWWFFHLPHNSGVSSGRLNNWWPYIFDLNVFDGSAVNHPVTGGPETPSSFPPVAGEYGTEQTGTEWWGYWCSFTDFGPFGQISAITRNEDPDLVKEGNTSLRVLIDQELFHYNGRNDLRYPITRNARWNLGTLGEIGVSLKLGLNPSFVTGANPVIRLCKNGGNRIEFAPLKNGLYANHFLDPAFQSGGGWSTFHIPVAGNASWEVNVIGYIDPALDPAGQAAARQQLKQNILAEVNYFEVSVRSAGGRGQQVSFYLDGLEFR
jgi:hypothetical protein